VIVLFVGVVATAAGFLIGFFVKGNKARGDCASQKVQTNNNQQNQAWQVSEVFSKFEEEVSIEELRENLRYFSKKIHLAGSERSREMAQYLAQQWREYEFDDVEMPSYKVLLSFPMEDKPNIISVLDSNGTIVKNITEQLRVSSGPGIKNTSLYTPYTAYSMNGTGEGKLIYINNGEESDFEELEKRNISVNGSILITRNYFGFFQTSFVAAKKGAKGLLIYPDPEDYAREGIGSNLTYPNTPWLSSDAVLLAGVYSRLGDPLTPYLPSLEGIYRIAVKDLKNLPQILLQPISYGTAQFLLQQVSENDIPSEWLKNLNSTFRFDQNYKKKNQTIRLSINNQFVQKTIYNVIATITGREEPDRYVFLGNHRDAWSFGAADASTGLSVLKETSRVLSRLLKQGWRPRRTIKLCSFGGEEFGLIGSVEWMDENSLIFKERGVAYLNTDVPVQGRYSLLAQTDPLLTDLIYKWTKQVRVPVDEEKYESIFDVMLKRGPTPLTPGEPNLSIFKFASDYIPFYFMAGIPSADFSYFFNYSKENGWQLYPSYHSQEDTFYWLQHFADPTFEIHRAMTLLMGGMLVDVADSQIIPLNVTRLKDSLHKAFSKLTASKTPLINATLVQQSISAVNRSLIEFSRRCNSFASALIEASKAEKVESLKLRILNNQLNQVGKAFVNPRVKNVNPVIYQHVAFSEKFSGFDFTSTKDTNDTSEIQEQLSLVTVAISSAANILKLIEIPSHK